MYILCFKIVNKNKFKNRLESEILGNKLIEGNYEELSCLNL